MKRGEFTWCGQKALKKSGIVVVEDVTATDCPDCPLVGAYSGKAGMAIRLEYRDRIYGILSVSIPAEMATNAAEQSLLNEVAGDIAFALHNMEQEEELRKHRDHLEELVEERTQALRESEEKYRVLFETAKDAVFLSDETGRFVDVNPVACESLGYSREELLKLSNKEIDADPRGYEAFQKIRNGLLKEATFEVNQRRKDGSLLLVEITGSFFTSGGQRLALAIARDITERKRTEEREMEAVAAAAAAQTSIDTVEAMGDGVFLLNMDGKITSVNPGFERMTGYEASELVEQSIAEMIPKWFKPEEIETPAGLRRTILEGKSPVPTAITWITKDGREVPTIFTVSFIRDAEGNPTTVVATIKDISKLKRMEEELVRKEKLAVLGQLAGGLGHELRNPLGVMSNAVYYLKTTLSDADETTKEYLEIISSEVGNAENIVSDLLDLSRIRPAEREKIAASELVAQVVEKQPPPEKVEVNTEIPSELPPVFVDPRQIGQVLDNLVTNSYQAMPEGGKLKITTRAEKSQVNLYITDTGCGISKENLKKIFEPLFTTRARGIGLGLAVSKNLVEVNGGSIEVESEEGKGSTFTVILPTKEVQS